jgi:outer membrane protein OmpA-like peptidoglycan-associated protein
MAAQIALSQQRADHVRDELVALGASPNQISTSGVGSNFPEYVRPDRDAAGAQLPGPATFNRSVRITLTNS